ncbi:MAG: PAS domain S-box protein [Janthinobacterium lividum]
MPFIKQPSVPSAAAENLLNTIVEGTTDAIFLKGLDGRYQMINAAGARFIGKPVSEIIGKDDTQLFPAAAATQTRSNDQQVLSTGVSSTYEDTEIIDGISRTYLSTKDVCRDKQGAAIGIIGISRDITERKQADDRLRMLAAALENANDVVLITEAEPVDHPGPRVIYVNDTFTRMTGYSPQEILGKTPRILQGPGTDPKTCAFLRGKLKAWKPVEVELLNYRKDGTSFWSQLNIRPVANEKGWYTHWVSIQRDVTERRNIEEEERTGARRREGKLTHDLQEKTIDLEEKTQDLLENEARFRGVVEGLGEGILITDFDDIVLYSNPRLTEMTGWANLEMHGHPAYRFLLAPEDWPILHKANTQRQNGVSECWESRFLRKDASFFWGEIKATPYRDSTGCIVGTLGAITDISTRKALQDEQQSMIAEQARMLAEALERADHDPLTGLLNHRAFQKKLEEETNRAQREGSSLVVVILDLDNFKFFNDAYGHAAGDEVLRQVANAMRQQSRSYDTLGRFGGDEFVMLFPGTAEGQKIADGLQEHLAHLGYRPPGYDTAIPISASIGIAVFPNEASTRADAVALADKRLLQAKSGGGEAANLIAELRVRLPSSSVDGFAMLSALVTAVDAKDRYTLRHSEDVLVYSLQIAQVLGLDAAAQHTVQVAALLHDVGKIGVPDAILRKPGQLTEAEFKAIQQHPQMGAAIVGAVLGFEGTLAAIRSHHERWNGEGYPAGLQGENIPLIARLMAVADAFSAMTTDRPYRNGMTDAKAMSILQEGSGTHWDPTCIQAFLHARICS